MLAARCIGLLASPRKAGNEKQDYEYKKTSEIETKSHACLQINDLQNLSKYTKSVWNINNEPLILYELLIIDYYLLNMKELLIIDYQLLINY